MSAKDQGEPIDLAAALRAAIEEHRRELARIDLWLADYGARQDAAIDADSEVTPEP